MANADANLSATITAKVIRADGTEESLGVISATGTEVSQVESLIAKIKKAHNIDDGDGTRPMTLDEVNALHEQRSAENDEASEAARQDSPMTELLGGES